MTGTGPPAPWHAGDFGIAVGAAFVNKAGDWVLLVALPVYVFVETGSGASTALLFVAQLVAGALVGPFAGTLVDRWDLRRTLVATNLAQAVAVLPLLAVTPDRIWPAYIVMAAQSLLNRVNDPAQVALVPRVADRGALTAANAALAGAESSARLIGSPLGGILVAWGGLTPVVLVDALSFALVALAMGRIGADTSPEPSPDGNRLQVRGAIAVVRDRPPLAPLLSLHAFAQVAQGAFLVLFVVFVVDTLDDDGSGLGLIRGTMAIGALIGSAAIARLASRVQATTLFGLGLIGMGVVSMLFWNTPNVTTAIAPYVVLFSLSGIPGAALTVGLFTTLQTTSPPHALGSVTGLMGAGEAIGVTCGSIVTGLAVDHVPLGALLNVQASIYLVTGAVALVAVRSGPGRHAHT